MAMHSNNMSTTNGAYNELSFTIAIMHTQDPMANPSFAPHHVEACLVILDRIDIEFRQMLINGAALVIMCL